MWTEASPDNDQTARAFRDNRVVMMFPSLRGGNENPGPKESFFGEVDDVLAAAEFLAQQPGVDPTRLYLGGHSTGGTLALLVAESSARFRAVFAFGPVADVGAYPDEVVACVRSRDEIRLRSPGYWLHSVQSPTFVIEGEVEGRGGDLTSMERRSKNPFVHFFLVPGQSHFSVLSPANAVLARKVAADSGAGAFALAPSELGL